MKKLFISFFSSLVIFTQLTACTSTQPTAAPTSASTSVTTDAVTAEATATLQPVHLKVSVRNFISFAPLFIARDEGYFTEQGLEVELIDFSTSSSFETIPLLVSREIDAGGIILDVSVFNAILQGNNLKYVADKGFLDPNNCATDAYVASSTLLASGTLVDATSIKGKNVGIQSPGGSPEYIMDVLLAQNNLIQDDLQTVLIPNPAARMEALANGSIDISVLSEPWITNAKKSGAGEVWIPFSEITPNMSLGILAFGPSILEDNPEAGTRFMIAYLKAVEQFNEGKTDRNVEIIANYTRLPPEAIKASCWTSIKPGGSIDTDTTMAFQKWAVEKGFVDGELELDQFWTSQFIDEASQKISK